MESSKIINRESTDKEFGMNFCEKLIRLEGKDIRTIMWVKTDENGHHWYEVSWSVVQPSN